MLGCTFIRALRNFHFFKQKNMVSGKQQVFVIANNNNNNNNNNDNENNNNYNNQLFILLTLFLIKVQGLPEELELS